MLDSTHALTSKYFIRPRLDSSAYAYLVVLAFVSVTQAFAKSSDFSSGNANKVIIIDQSELGPPWGPKKKKGKRLKVVSQGAIRIPVISPRFKSGRPDLVHDRSNVQMGESTPIERKILPLPNDHPCVTNRKYNRITGKMSYVPPRIDFDQETERAVFRLRRFLEIEKRNGKTPALTELIKEAKGEVKKAQNNAMAAGNFYVNGIPFGDYHKNDAFPDAENLIMVSKIANDQL